MTLEQYWDSLPQFKRNGGYCVGYAPKSVDTNQSIIVEIFRDAGFTVNLLHKVGEGMFDLLVSKSGLGCLAEVKDGRKAPSERRLTPPQKRFHSESQMMRCVVTNADEAVEVIKQMNDILYIIRKAGLKFEVIGCREKQYEPTLYEKA